MPTTNKPDRRPYLRAIPPSPRVQQRLAEVQREARQLKILLRTAKEIEAAADDDAEVAQ